MTTQIKDVCIYQGGEYQMPVFLDFPVDNLRIKELSSEEFGKENSSDYINSTACWRNYIATWEIKNKQLFLVRLEGKFRIIEGKPLFADWFTGEFGLPQGELIDCNVELDFSLKYEKAITLKFVSGVLVGSVLREQA